MAIKITAGLISLNQSIKAVKRFRKQWNDVYCKYFGHDYKVNKADLVFQCGRCNKVWKSKNLKLRRMISRHPSSPMLNILNFPKIKTEPVNWNIVKKKR